MMKNLSNVLYTFLVCLISTHAFSQGEANNWIFGAMAGIQFTSGTPENLNYSMSLINYPSTVVSDSAGNLLFYSDGFRVYNRNYQVMENGTDILGGRDLTTCIAFAKPGSSRFYYLFTVGEAPGLTPPTDYGGRYAIIDMQANGGLGKVTVKNIMMDQGEDAMVQLTATFHKNNHDIWLILECQDYNHYFYKVYLLTNTGIFYKHMYEQIKYFPGYQGGTQVRQLRVSPDGKKMINAGDMLGAIQGWVYSFNNETGQINYSCGIKSAGFQTWGAEFSPSSEFVYISGPGGGGAPHVQYNWIVQYNANYTDSVSFNNSKVVVGHFQKNNNHGWYGNMQCAPDGKIYGARSHYDTLFAINKPDLYGLACEATNCAFILNGNSELALPQFLTSYAQRFYFTGTCAGEPFQFTSHFFPEPESILWEFGDGETSVELNPSHVFIDGGNYSVTATVVFPNGSTGEATRTVYVAGLPESALPEELTVCKGEQVTLDAGIFSSYIWSTGDTVQTIPVSDTGYYWVEIVNDTGCMARDSLHLKWHPLPQLTTDTIISPTTCGNSIGAITGVNIIGGTAPYNVFWLNSIGDTIGTTNNLYNLGVENYYLWVTDQSGCNVLVASIDIQNFDHNLIITGVDPTETWCSLPLGELEVQVESGLSDRLFYSIDNWATYQTNGSFTGLLPNTPYYVKVKDSLDCEAVYAGNPVYIQDNPGPEADASSLPATGSNANGSITLTASGFGNLSYSLNGGTPQSSGEFTGLIAGTYTWRVEDENGCFTDGSIEVGQEAGFIISAIAGNSAVCLGNAPVAPLLIENFTGVQAFTATLEYDATLVNCEGFRPGSVHPQLEANLIAEVFPATQRIVVNWSGSAPLTLSGTVTVLDLVFSATQAGNSFLTWDQAPAATWFTGEYGSIEPAFQIGQIQVNNPPVLAQQFPENVCEGELAWLSATATGNEPLTYQWTLPDGSNVNDPFLIVFNASTANSGQYRVKVSDALGCSDSTLLTLQVTPNPTEWFEADTISFEHEYILTAPVGYASYLWSTGDTLPEITINTEGLYTLQLTTYNQCVGADSTYLKMLEAESPFLVPNAFTPNGDGLNDTFRPVTDYDRFSHYSLVIYNSWGQRQFGTTRPADGWDGKDAAAGVYVWVITYADYLGKVSTLRGSVTLVR